MLCFEIFEAKSFADLRHPKPATATRQKAWAENEHIDPKDGFFWHYYNGHLMLHSQGSPNYSAALTGKEMNVPWNTLNGIVDLNDRTVTVAKENYGQNKERQRNIVDIKTFQKALLELQHYGVKPDFKIRGAPPHIGKTVADVLKQNDPTDDIMSGRPIVMYHGTSLSRWKTIERQGLRPGKTPGAYNDLIPGYSENNVYLATTAKGAEFYGKRQAKKDKESDYVVLHVDVPDPAKLLTDDGWLAGRSRYRDPETNEYKLHEPEKLRQLGADPERMRSSGRTMGELAYRGAILPNHLKLLRTGKIK